ncbi:PREDICTED: leukocyte-associated immunoglobulin-like receptor 1 [Galeopterus variegatus]|uniref:Leukocyte-associated immunoglobulin-like receptor 1 n=1 Tax=Galeopterus variegatus TaxID=482537 RepID=A0ABM0PZR3_GALVR|nr:PREDICTED: leukocyte-associated immunoglobulin-like receptor 1 [Galeopterus variegatus]
MSLHLTTLLGLVLSLGQMIHTQEGALPKPSIRAEPNSVIPHGRPVTIVCQSTVGFEIFRLEKVESSVFRDEKNNLTSNKEARFFITSMSEDTAGRYFCRYFTRNQKWSDFSAFLELMMTSEDITWVPHTPDSALFSRLSQGATQMPSDDSNNGGAADNLIPSSLVTPAPRGLRTELLYILIGILVAFLLCLLVVLFFLHLQHQKKQGPCSSKAEEQRPQERLSPAADVRERTPGTATVDRLPEKDREMDTSTPAAGDLQEVTYVQLDLQALTQRTAHAVSPQFMESTAVSSTYAALSRH